MKIRPSSVKIIPPLNHVFLKIAPSLLFKCNCGVRQGENLSPALFCLSLNDLGDYLDSKGHTGIKLNDIEHDIDTFLRIMILLYADDTILIGDDP